MRLCPVQGTAAMFVIKFFLNLYIHIENPGQLGYDVYWGFKEWKK